MEGKDPPLQSSLEHPGQGGPPERGKVNQWAGSGPGCAQCQRPGHFPTIANSSSVPENQSHYQSHCRASVLITALQCSPSCPGKQSPLWPLSKPNPEAPKPLRAPAPNFQCPGPCQPQHPSSGPPLPRERQRGHPKPLVEEQLEASEDTSKATS